MQIAASSGTLAQLSHRILVIDDNIDGAEALAEMLRLDGHEVRTAYDGYEALATGEQFLPSMVFLDISMPGINGYKTCELMRHTPWGEKTVIYAHTAHNREEDRERFKRAGFDGYLTKPLAPEVFFTLLH